MSMLFKEIEPRININMANYKEIVFKYLKLYKYPGLISMSLLKSGNNFIFLGYSEVIVSIRQISSHILIIIEIENSFINL